MKTSPRMPRKRKAAQHVVAKRTVRCIQCGFIGQKTDVSANDICKWCVYDAHTTKKRGSDLQNPRPYYLIVEKK